jgi:outer membrane protein W
MRKSVLVLMGCLVMAAAPAWAGGAFSLFGSYGEINEYNKTYGAGARLTLGGHNLVVDLTGTWFPSINGTAVKNPDVRDSIQVIPFDLGLRWIFGQRSELRPYIGAGGSYALVDFGTADADDEFGYYGLAGLQIGMFDSGGLYLEVIYRWLETDVVAGGLIYPDQQVGGLAGNFGVSFNF